MICYFVLIVESGFREFRVFYGQDNASRSNENLWGVVQYTTMQLTSLAIANDSLSFTHVFVIIGLDSLYDELYWLIRSGSYAYKNVCDMCLLAGVDVSKNVMSIRKGESLDSQALSKVER
jgi:hypothetical protein